MSQNLIRILLIEDEEFDARRVKNTIQYFEDKIKIVSVVSNGDAALKLLQDSPAEYDLIIMDYQIAGTLHGVELIKRIKNVEDTIQIIVITKLTIDLTDLNFARTLMDAGAFWYCTKYPNDIEDYIYQPTDFIISIFNAFERKKLQEQRNKSHKKLKTKIEEILTSKQIISNSAEMEKVKYDIERLTNNEATILITGASGTGKELVAYNIHYKSKRKYENFVPINCGSLPNDLIESELFGYEKGSFTGAANQKDGLFQIADNGTIFLDEIAELPLSAQVKLLRVIQDGEIDKIGRTKTIKVNVRIIAATNKDLRKEIEAGRFREDLYYRLNVILIPLLPLEKRRDDISVLTIHFLKQFSFQMGIETPTIPEEVMDFLVKYDWPGNVREMKNVIQRLLFISASQINLEHIQQAIIPALKKEEKTGMINFDEDNIMPWKELEREIKYEYFKFVRNNSSSDAETASKLGLAPPNYFRMSKELGLK
jgi:two-component system, NtrC family, response regulator AtoC